MSMCKECGHLNKEENKICVECGSKIYSTQPEATGKRVERVTVKPTFRSESRIRRFLNRESQTR